LARQEEKLSTRIVLKNQKMTKEKKEETRRRKQCGHAADPRDGEHCSINGRTDTFRTRTVLVVAAESKQSTQLDKLDPRAITHTLSSCQEACAWFSL
jgi:hypothetical protein